MDEEMIDILAYPDKIHDLESGEKIMLDGKVFIVETSNIIEDGIYLVLENDAYKTFYKTRNPDTAEKVSKLMFYVRPARDGNAVIPKAEMVALLKRGLYVISNGSADIY